MIPNALDSFLIPAASDEDEDVAGLLADKGAVVDVSLDDPALLIVLPSLEDIGETRSLPDVDGLSGAIGIGTNWDEFPLFLCACVCAWECPRCCPLWISLSSIEITFGFFFVDEFITEGSMVDFFLSFVCLFVCLFLLSSLVRPGYGMVNKC